jgi:hypothetical protein
MPRKKDVAVDENYQQRDQIMGMRRLRQTIMKVAKEEDGIVAD